MAYDEHHEHDDYAATEGGLYASASVDDPDRAARHRRRLMAGITGALVALAGAGFLVTRLMNEQQPTLPEPAALAPQTTPATTVPTPEETASVTRTPKVTRHAVPVEQSPAPSIAASRPASPDQAEARASAAIEELRERLRVSERTKVTENTFEDGVMRIVSSWRDVSGEPLLQRARDAGAPAGSGARCTTGISNEPDMALGRPPTLMCWRTSASRSVVVVTSATGAAPADCVARLEAEWPKPD